MCVEIIQKEITLAVILQRLNETRNKIPNGWIIEWSKVLSCEK